MHTRQVTQFGPVSPSPVNLVMAPSQVLISGIVGCSDGAADSVGVPDELVAIVRRVVGMSQIEQ